VTTTDDLHAWQEANRQHLLAAVDRLHRRMGGPAQDDRTLDDLDRAVAAIEAAMPSAAALIRLADAFGLDRFETDLLLLCFAAEVDPRFRDDQAPVTISFAMEVVPGAHWGALDPGGPLRRWGVIDVDPGPPLADAPLRVADDVRSCLLGFPPHPRPGDTATLVPPPPVVTERQTGEADALAREIVVASNAARQVAAVELHGAGAEDRTALATLTAGALGAELVAIDLRDLPAPGPDLDAHLRRLSRYARVTQTQLLVTSDDANATDNADASIARDRLRRTLALVSELTFLAVPTATVEPPTQRPLVRHAVHPPDAAERTETLAACLEPVLRHLRVRPTRLLDAELDRLGWQFRLPPRTAEAVCRETEAIMSVEESRSATTLAQTLRAACRRATRARMDPLAQRVRLGAITDVVLPARERADLDLLAAEITLDQQVNGRWGLGRHRDPAVVALFSGPSGTGKTHAAATVARAVGLDLYRVDLAAVLSKYIGETEQNLGRLFDAAAHGGVILLFDEADALFGKRSDVKDSHDRYANITTSYLLQRIEQAPVPTILTTNMRDALDPAFARRLHVVIEFPFPDAPAREAIWRHVYPEQTPTEELEPELLAQLAVTGAGIDRVARRAAFLAAAEERAVSMRHLAAGARREARYTGRDLGPQEIAKWER
jgi:hypothetical protein